MATVRIGIDCRLAGIQHTGIGRYIDELVKRVTKDESVKWVLFVADDTQLADLRSQPNVTMVNAPYRHYSVAEQLQMPRIFARADLDLLHSPHFNIPLAYRGKLITTVHDLLWHDQPNSDATTLGPLTHALKYQAYRLIVQQAIGRSQCIIVPSAAVKAQILHHYPAAPADKIEVIYEGVDEIWFRKASKQATVHSAQKKSQVALTGNRIPKTENPKILFYTGSLYPHKNLALILDALTNLPDYELHLSSSRSVFVEELLALAKHKNLDGRVTHLGRLDDEALKNEYRRASALVQPSKSEGFGLTGLEAMAAGLPVIASNTAVFSEVYGHAYIPFDPNSAESFVNAVRTLEQRDRSEIIAHGLAQAQQYSWDKMAQQTLHIYKEYLGS